MVKKQLPFMVTLLDAPKDSASLVCRSVIRYLPQKRMVCQAIWEGRAVVARLLFQRKHSRRHWLRLERGIAALLARSIPTPITLYSGRYQSGLSSFPRGYCIVSAVVEGSTTLGEAWEKARTMQDRKGLLQNALVSLGKLHETGILQRDLHFQNLLLDDSTTYILDQDSIVVSDKPLGKRISLANVGLFFAQIPPRYDAWVPALFGRYAQARGWQDIEGTTDFLSKAIKRSRARRVKKLLQKIFRESTAYGCIKNWGLRAVYRRELEALNEQALVREPDSVLCESESGNLKRGNTSTVTKTMVKGQSLVIKRYNIKNFFHGVCRAFRKTRAATSWANAHRLGLLDISTASPLALVEKRIGPIRRESFYISSHVSGKNCKDFFDNACIPWLEKIQIAEKIVELFSSLAHHKISHGDTKATNFLINGDKVTVVDLDSMREHRSERSFRRAFKKDIERFLENWEDTPDVFALLKEKLTGFVDN